ncbi:MAG: PAT family beta-lactamase induction signal transducer AmpG, partial [Bermanella sp.]
MLNNINVQHSWKESFKALLHKEVMYMLLLGFSAGLPILLIFSTLSLWLTEAGIEKSAVTYFSWAALGYSFKFVWAPLVDCLPIPFLTKALGLRRSWLLVSQLSIICAITLMACSDPAVENQLIYMALAAVLLGFSSATQDISIDAYRIEAVSADLQAIVSAGYMAGYRVGMIVAGAVALYIASYLGTTVAEYQYQAWKITYHIMSAFMLIGILATFLISEPIKREKDFSYLPSEYFRLLLTFAFSVLIFIACFVLTSGISVDLKSSLGNVLNSTNLSGFLIEILRLVLAIILAVIAAKMIIETRFVNQQLIKNSYVAP